MRGEYFLKIDPTGWQSGSPPHARGIHGVHHRGLSGTGITPACAGNTQHDRKYHRVARDHPRMRGEYCYNSCLSLLQSGSPPHARGIHDRPVLSARSPGITPACAGNTYSENYGGGNNRDHPRMRGEYFFHLSISCILRGSPPHARGILLKDGQIPVSSGITPACAGNTPYSIRKR